MTQQSTKLDQSTELSTEMLKFENAYLLAKEVLLHPNCRILLKTCEQIYYTHKQVITQSNMQIDSKNTNAPCFLTQTDLSQKHCVPGAGTRLICWT